VIHTRPILFRQTISQPQSFCRKTTLPLSLGQETCSRLPSSIEQGISSHCSIKQCTHRRCSTMFPPQLLLLCRVRLRLLPFDQKASRWSLSVQTTHQLLRRAAHMPHQVIQDIVTLSCAKGHLQDDKVSSTSMTIMAIPHTNLAQDSEGATPTITTPVQHQLASEGGPVPIQELKPQWQLDHVHTSVDVIDAPSSVTTEHLGQAKYLSATYAPLSIDVTHKEGTQVALTTTVSPYAMRIHPVMNKAGQDQLLNATTEGIRTMLQEKHTSQVLGPIQVFTRIYRHSSYILKGKSIMSPARLMQTKHKHHNRSVTGLHMFKATGTNPSVHCGECLRCPQGPALTKSAVAGLVLP